MGNPEYEEFGDVFSRGDVEGYLGKDCFGRLYIDKCASTEEHLARAVAPEGKERPGCRTYLDDLLVPERIIGDNVSIRYTLRITYCTENK